MKSKNCQFSAKVFGLIACVGIFSSGCAFKIPITNLENAYGTGFRSLAIPDEAEIKRKGASRDLPSYTQSEVWSAGLAVAMQRGPVVRAEESKRTIIAPPYAILIESKEQRIVLYCAYMDDLHYNTENSKQELFVVKPEEKHQFVEDVLERVVTQASIHRNLGPAGKWKWLPE